MPAFCCVVTVDWCWEGSVGVVLWGETSSWRAVMLSVETAGGTECGARTGTEARPETAVTAGREAGAQWEPKISVWQSGEESRALWPPPPPPPHTTPTSGQGTLAISLRISFYKNNKHSQRLASSCIAGKSLRRQIVFSPEKSRPVTERRIWWNPHVDREGG